MADDPCISLWVREERAIKTFTLSEWVLFEGERIEDDELPELVAYLRKDGCLGHWCKFVMVTDAVAFEHQVKAMDIGSPPPPPPFTPF